VPMAGSASGLGQSLAKVWSPALGQGACVVRDRRVSMWNCECSIQEEQRRHE